jgi:hypothetical protein
MIELKNRTATSDSNDILWVMLELTSVLVLLDRAVIFFSSIIVLTPTGNIWIVVLLCSGMKFIVMAIQKV